VSQRFITDNDALPTQGCDGAFVCAPEQPEKIEVAQNPFLRAVAPEKTTPEYLWSLIAFACDREG